jgi:hypothetical protein
VARNSSLALMMIASLSSVPNLLSQLSFSFSSSTFFGEYCAWNHLLGSICWFLSANTSCGSCRETRVLSFWGIWFIDQNAEGSFGHCPILSPCRYYCRWISSGS